MRQSRAFGALALTVAAFTLAACFDSVDPEHEAAIHSETIREIPQPSTITRFELDPMETPAGAPAGVGFYELDLAFRLDSDRYVHVEREDVLGSPVEILRRVEDEGTVFTHRGRAAAGLRQGRIQADVDIIERDFGSWRNAFGKTGQSLDEWKGRLENPILVIGTPEHDVHAAKVEAFKTSVADANSRREALVAEAFASLDTLVESGRRYEITLNGADEIEPFRRIRFEMLPGEGEHPFNVALTFDANAGGDAAFEAGRTMALPGRFVKHRFEPDARGILFQTPGGGEGEWAAPLKFIVWEGDHENGYIDVELNRHDPGDWTVSIDHRATVVIDPETEELNLPPAPPGI